MYPKSKPNKLAFKLLKKEARQDIRRDYLLALSSGNIKEDMLPVAYAQFVGSDPPEVAQTPNITVQNAKAIYDQIQRMKKQLEAN